jgi:hypothetical protein
LVVGGWLDPVVGGELDLDVARPGPGDELEDVPGLAQV